MGKSLYIAEKPSVAQEFAKALKLNTARRDGYLESEEAIVTWCVGHLVTMSYPDAYDEKYKKWSLDTIPFIPEEFRYEVIPGVKKQFQIVSGLLNREDVTCIYVCTDSGREGEYIYRLVEAQSGVQGKERKRVWIDSQTEEEILRGIREAKDESEYDNLCASAYLRAKEDYLMGINFSRALTLKFSYPVKTYLNADKCVVSVGRVMTCVLGMVVKREREIRNFVKTPFYRVMNQIAIGTESIDGEWRAVEGSAYLNSPLLYKENGFKKEEDAKHLIDTLTAQNAPLIVANIEKKKEVKNPPLLYNLAELQNDCSKLFKISPDQTLSIIQELYEKKLCTYPRTDARVLSSAVAKEIHKNIQGLTRYPVCAEYATQILQEKRYAGIAKTKYTNDKLITDHYAIIPTGQGLQNLQGLHATAARVYEIIVRRFLSIFMPSAVYQKIALTTTSGSESFFSNFKVLKEEGYLALMNYSFTGKKDASAAQSKDAEAAQTATDGKENTSAEEKDEEETSCDEELLIALSELKKGAELSSNGYVIKPGETSPPKRYNSGSMILAMENAGQFIEDEELRSQIKGSGIGTSATRAEILKKLVNNDYLALNKKTQIITPTFLGEIIYEVVNASISSLLNPELTASWEKGLTMVAQGEIAEDVYMGKLDQFVRNKTNQIKQVRNQTSLYRNFDQFAQFYKTTKKK
ncbi:MAG: type IA DNA topoisomerase [Lachnospiraceae bacterium]|nr:type IA DNA topoisomerase [Lachnospiraceae bacterium]